MTFDTLWFLSDYGLEDEFVGVVKAVVRAVAPTVAVSDVTHQIPPHDIRAGALALARSMQYLTLVPCVVPPTRVSKCRWGPVTLPVPPV